MKNLTVSLLVSVACCVAAVAISLAGEQPAEKSLAAWPKGAYAALDKLPDWGGIWVLAQGRPVAGAPANEPFKPKGRYLAAYEAWKAARNENGEARKDTSNCMPPGMPRMMGTGQYPTEFLFTPGRVTTLHEAWMQTRTIFTDGRSHPGPDDLEPGIFGHSVGKWEGDTLVVDTIGIKLITEIDTGLKHSDKLHIIERIHLVKDAPDQLVVEMTIEDPDALEAPVRRNYTFRRQRDANLMEFICAENDRNPVDAAGRTGFK